MKISSEAKKSIRLALKEDLRTGDKTARLLIPNHAKSTAVIRAKESGVFFGEKVVRELVRSLDKKLKVKWQISDGKRFKRGQPLFQLKGRLRSLLAIERTLLNYVAHLCGVATVTAAFVKKVKPYRVHILDTRKTTPLLRELEKAAVRAGGGHNHRFGLYDEIFVKENHRGQMSLRKLSRYVRKFVIEVRNQRELKEALTLKPRIILFDNYSVSQLKAAVKFTRTKDRKVLLEASGGIQLKNAASYARTGINQISVGAITHSVRSLDLSMTMKP